METWKALKPDLFCWGARTCLTVLKVNPRNSCSTSQLTRRIYRKCFSQMCPTWTSKYLSRLLLVCPDFAVIRQCRTKTGSSNIFYTTFKKEIIIELQKTVEGIFKSELEQFQSKSEKTLSDEHALYQEQIQLLKEGCRAKDL